MKSPADIRTEMRALRRSLPQDIARRNSAAIARHLTVSPVFERSQRIAAYLANDGEAGTEPLFDAIWARGKAGYLPILRTMPTRCLWFGRYQPETVLAPNRFRIPEPAVGEDTLDEPWRLDLVLVPLVAFDLAGNRIGMGGGYYDRTFAYLKKPGTPRSPVLIGLAFECQKRERLPAEPWDVPLDGVATEEAFYTFTDLSEPALPHLS